MDVKKARAILMKEGKIAVVKSERSGAYMLPGGRVEKGEEEIETIIREISEELGIDISKKDIEGPFFSRQSSYWGEGANGEYELKKTLTDFFIANTDQDFNKEKMHLTKKERRRGATPEWINPSKLEYMLATQVDNKDANLYLKKYAREYIRVYNKYKEYQIKKEKREAEER